MKLDQLRYFVKVVECHSFNQAAHELYMTQPALTKSIQALENELQVVLLHRAKSGTYPTEHGLRVYNDCKDILANLEEKIVSWQSLVDEHEKIAGTVHLAAIPVLCNLVLEEIICGIQEAYPAITIALHDIPMNTFPEELLRGRFNVGITSVTVDQLASQRKRYDALSFQARTLLADEYSVYMSVQHPLAKCEALTVEDCAKQNLITYSSNQPDSVYTVFDIFKSKQYFNSIGNILQMVADNKGVTVLMQRAMANNWYAKHGYICEKHIVQSHIMPCEHILLWADEEILSAAEKAVVQYIRYHYARFYEKAVCL